MSIQDFTFLECDKLSQTILALYHTWYLVTLNYTREGKLDFPEDDEVDDAQRDTSYEKDKVKLFSFQQRASRLNSGLPPSWNDFLFVYN